MDPHPSGMDWGHCVFFLNDLDTCRSKFLALDHRAGSISDKNEALSAGSLTVEEVEAKMNATSHKKIYLNDRSWAVFVQEIGHLLQTFQPFL